MFIKYVMKRIILIALGLLSLAGGQVNAQSFDLTKSQPVYADSIGYGYDITDAPTKKSIAPFYFSVRVPDGNYRVTVTLGSKSRAAETCVRAESRRLFVENCVTKKGEFKTVSFIVSKRTPEINEKQKVRIKPGEVGSMTWDDKLTLEFNGASPAVKSIEITPDTTATTVFLCGNSTVVDQGKEPWASWGQMIPRWFDDKVCVANFGESGLTATSFLAQNRLEKILSMMKEGDYVICEFGHNDEKEKGPGTGAWYHYSVALKKFVDQVRAKKGSIIFCTPTQRRFFEKDGKTLRNTHGDFPAAMKAVAERENVPVIDLNALTKVLFETMGEEECKHCLVHYPMGTFPWQTKEFADNTHFNPFGAYQVAKIVATGLKNIKSPLAEHLVDFTDYDPSRPDNWEKFSWPLSVLFDGKKPDGN